MRIVADEGIDKQIVEGLKAEGHDVDYIAEFAPGIPDEEVFQLASSENAILLTVDRDFGEMVSRYGFSGVGIVLARLHELSSDESFRIVSKVFAEHGEELPTAFTVVSAGSIRIRRWRPSSGEETT